MLSSAVPRAAFRLFLAAAFIAVAVQLGCVGAAVGRLDPCSLPGKLIRGRGFYIGLAFWPGGTIQDWGSVLDEDTASIGLNPCLTEELYNSTNMTHQEYLISKGVVFSTYEVRVDRMTMLRGNPTEQHALLPANDTEGVPSVVSVVAFRGKYRSAARYFSSGDSNITKAIGTVKELAVIARVDGGDLQQLQWNDVTCGACGGRKSARCMTALSTDALQYSCTVGGNCSASFLTDPCLPSIYMGFSGDDKNHRTFQSGYQITKINQFSLVAFYQRASDTLSGILNTIATGGLGDSTVDNGSVGGGGVGDSGDSAA